MRRFDLWKLTTEVRCSASPDDDREAALHISKPFRDGGKLVINVSNILAVNKHTGCSVCCVRQIAFLHIRHISGYT